MAAIRVTSLLGMGMLRNTFVTSVCRFTMLHSPAAMQLKNAHAFRALLVVADENGNHMHVGPFHIQSLQLGPAAPNMLCCYRVLDVLKHHAV